MARFAVVASALLFVAMAASASAAVRPVDISEFKFVPQSVTITAGDTVTWTNRDAAAHSARVNGVGTTAVLTQGQSGSLQFATAGTFPYDCGIHGASMMGTVIVRAAATQPPTPVPTPRPTVAPTAAPTVAPTLAPTAAPTLNPSPSPTVTAIALSTTALPSPTPSVAVAAPTEQVPDPATERDPTPGVLLVTAVVVLLSAAAVIGLIRLGRAALTRIRR